MKNLTLQFKGKFIFQLVKNKAELYLISIVYEAVGKFIEELYFRGSNIAEMVGI